MANVEVYDLPEKSAAVGSDELEIQETGGGASKKVRLDNIAAEVVNAQPAENGFPNLTDSNVSFTDGTRTFAISPSASSFDFWSGGSKYTKSTEDSVVIPDAEGLHYIYYNGSGVLSSTQTYNDDLITDYALVSIVYWDVTNNTGIYVAEERHGTVMDSLTHLYNHKTVGAKYGNGMLVSDIVIGNGSLDSHAQMGVASGTIWDEDLKHTLAADAAPTSIPIIYRNGSGGAWRLIDATSFIVTTTGTGRAAWNQDTGSNTWQLTEITSGNFLCMHLYATNDVNHPYFLLVGQAEYATASEAQQGSSTELLDLKLNGLPFVEFKSVATILLQSANVYTNSVKSRVVQCANSAEWIDWRYLDIGVVNNVSGATQLYWGDIQGTLSNQSDLQAALDGKIDGSNNFIELQELSSDPADPQEGFWRMWMSDGTGSGDEGDVMIKITAGSVTKTATLVDFSAL